MVFTLSIIGESGEAPLDQNGSVMSWRPSAHGHVAATASSIAESATRASPPDDRASFSIRAGSTRGSLHLGRARGQREHASRSSRCLPMAAVRESRRGSEKEGRVDLERRVLGGGPDQCERAIFDSPEQGVLLPLVEAMDLVDEKNRSPAAASGFSAPLRSQLERLSRSGEDGRDCDELVRRCGKRSAAQALSCPSPEGPRG